MSNTSTSTYVCIYVCTSQTKEGKKERKKAHSPISALGEIRDLHCLRCVRVQKKLFWLVTLIDAGSFSIHFLPLYLSLCVCVCPHPISGVADSVVVKVVFYCMYVCMKTSGFDYFEVIG